MDEPRWFAVHTKPRLEDRARIHLQRQGYKVFYPFIREKRYVGRKRVMRTEDRSLFSRYIFVALIRPSDNLFDVNEADGVSTVVRIGGEPLIVPHGVIDALYAITDADIDPETGEVGGDLVDGKKLAEFLNHRPEHWFKGRVGDIVEMKDEAPFFGLITAISSVAAIDKTGEISLWMNLFGKSHEVRAPATSVARVIAK